MGKLIDITGIRFGNITAICREIPTSYNNRKLPTWRFRCDCGKVFKAVKQNVCSGHTTSCGCFGKERSTAAHTTHGQSKTKTFSVWSNLRERCNNKKGRSYIRYGGRGIKVCKEWDKYTNFLKDMGEQPKGMLLDRIDNSLGYCKSNCRWTDTKTQMRNRDITKRVKYKGKLKTLGEWSEYLEMPYYLLYARIFNYKWSVERAFTEKAHV